MKKRLFILPLLAFACGAIAGCGDEKEESGEPVSPVPPSPIQPEDPDEPVTPPHTHKFSWKSNETEHWQECSCGEKKNLGTHLSFDKDGLCDECGYRISNDTSKLAPETFLNLKRVTELQDGKSYYLAVCKYNEKGKMMFINGEPHRDTPEGATDPVDYPYYMSETEVTSEEQLTDLATVTVDFKDGSDKLFNMKINKSGATNDGKYIGLYKSKATSGECVSIHCAAELGETYADPSEEGQVKECSYDFEWIETYNNYDLKTFCAMIQDERVGEEQPMPRFFGTGGKYVSVDCSNEKKAFAGDYNLAYFYEVADPE